MTRLEEKLYFQSVFDAIDQVYNMKKPQQRSSYEERLRVSFSKLTIPDWYNHEYTSINGLRKTKSHGHVPRVKRINNNNNDDTPDTSVSSSINSPHLTNGKHKQSHRHRSPSRSWSERPPIRHDSTASSYDTNGSVVNGRRSTTSNGSSSSSYAPGVQRVAQSSTWYKPRAFTPNGHTIEPPKPLPRYSKIDQVHTYSLDSSSLPLKNENVRYPIKPRTMAQAPIPSEESFVDVPSDIDVTLVEKSSTTQIHDTSIIPSSSIALDNTTSNLPRTNSLRSISSEAESYRSAVLPSADKNLLATDSSSYASVNERCLSPSTASYHTAIAGDSSSSSSITGYETPTPQLDNDDDNNTTLSSHSSLSDLSHAETLEPNVEDLDIVAISTAEQKSDSGMENFSLEPSNVDNSTTTITNINNNNHLPSIENTNWYDGSMETFIHRTIPNQIEFSADIREIPNDEGLREIDINAVGDEFYLFSPRTTTTDDEPSSSINDDNEIIENSKRIFTMEEKTFNDPFDFDDNNNLSSLMITNLDDILIDDDDDNNINDSRLLNPNYRRPIQEDILYEVEHENSLSDHSQNTSAIIPTNDKASIKLDANIDYLTSTDHPIIDEKPSSPPPLSTDHPVINEKPSSPPPLSTDHPVINEKPSSTSTNDNNILPIYILPPLYTTTKIEPSSSSLHIDTNNNFHKWDSFIHQFPDLTSPSAYTSKIRHRHYSVGSYYDNKTTTVTLNPNNTFYFLGSAPVSPLSRGSTTSSESHYHHQPPHHSPISYNALTRVHPFIETNNYRSSSLNREEKFRVITYSSPKSVEQKSPINVEKKPTQPAAATKIISPPTTRTSSVTFPQYEIPIIRPKIPSSTYQQESSFIYEKPPQLPPRPFQLEHEISPPRPPPPPPPAPPARSTRIKSTEKQPIQNIYQEIDSTSTDDDQYPTSNADLKFIRGAIERVFHFNNQSTSESGTSYEEIEDENLNQTNKSSSQYPAIEAIQRFYNQQQPIEQITNLDDVVILSNNSSTSKKSTKINKQKTSSSDEIDDTLNDIEDVDYQDEKFKRQILHNHSRHTSEENSPIHSSKTMKTSQETQTIERQKPFIRTIVPPIDIVTEMVIEQDELDNNGQVDDIDGDMVIFYDDIEIVEHSVSSCSSESDSISSSSASHHYSKPMNTSIHQPLPPPVPARTSKPIHLLNNSSTTTNKTYELEKLITRKKFDVNSVNDMLNHTEFNIGSSVTHRHPSARHFVGKLNNDDQPVITNEKKSAPFSTLPTKPSRSIIADTNALVKHIQNSLSRNSLHDTQVHSQNLSTSSKDLRTFVSSTYSPIDENTIDDNGMVHIRQQTNNNNNNDDDQTFKRQARLSKSFHNVSEYNSTDQYPKKDSTNLPSKSVENHLNEYQPNHSKPLNLTSVVTSTSFSALPNADDNSRMLSMKWYTGQVNENSEISNNAHHHPVDDLLHGYISTHSNRETQTLLAQLQASNDARIHAALDDIRSRVAQFDASKTREDLHTFMRYLESRLKDLNNTKIINQRQETDNVSVKSRTNSVNTSAVASRQLGRQHFRSSGSSGEGTNGYQPTPPRRTSQSSANQENPAVFDEMLNTVLGLPKKGVSTLPQTHPYKREKPTTPLVPTQITTNITTGREVGKRLFESGTYKDPRLVYDGPKKKEKEEQPLETSV